MLVLDHDRAGGYWGSVYVFTAIKGLQVIIDGPVGCENLPVTSVLHYTDALPPHELPIVVTGLGEEELGQTGTEGAMKRAHKTLDPDLPAVVVTGSIAEMIGGGVTPEGTNIQRFLPRTIDEDQWQSADRAMYWLWTEYGAEEGPGARSRASRGREAARQHHRPDLRHLQHAVRSRRDPPPGRRHRRRGQHGLPARQPSGRRAEARRRRRQHLHVPRVRPHALRGAGAALSAGADRPALARRKFLRKLGELLGLDPEPFIEREKHTTIKPLWDLWRSVTQDFFGTASFAHRRQRDLRARRPPFPRRRNGPALHLRGRRAAPGVKTDNDAVRAGRHARSRRSSCSAATTSACIWPRPAAACDLHPGVVPRRHHPPPHRHALHGLCRRHLSRAGSLQRAVRRAVPHPAARHRARQGRGRRRRACSAELAWDDDAKALLDELVEAQPVLVRISAAKRLRDAAERDARAAPARTRVTAARVDTCARRCVRRRAA